MLAISKKGGLELVLRPRRSQQELIGGITQTKIDMGLKVKFNPQSKGIQSSFWSPNPESNDEGLEFFPDNRLPHGAIDLTSEAKRLNVKEEVLIDNLMAHPLNLANGGFGFGIVADDGSLYTGKEKKKQVGRPKKVTPTVVEGMTAAPRKVTKKKVARKRVAKKSGRPKSEK